MRQIDASRAHGRSARTPITSLPVILGMVDLQKSSDESEDGGRSGERASSLEPTGLYGRLDLFQPETHVHIAIHHRSGHQMLSGFLTLAGPYIELAEAEVTVREERAHAQLAGNGHGLCVGGFSSFDVRGLAVRIDLGQTPESPGLLRRLIVVSRKIVGLLGAPDRVLHSV